MDLKNTVQGKVLSTLMAIVFAMSTLTIVPLAAVATGHTHNEGGWACTQAPSTTKLVCDQEEILPDPDNPEVIGHTHDDSCYATEEGKWTCVPPTETSEPTYTTIDNFHNAVDAVYEANEGTDSTMILAAIAQAKRVYNNLTDADKANPDVKGQYDALVAFEEQLKSGNLDEGIQTMNTYDQITVNYVVNGVTLRTETLNSGRYIQINNRVPYVADLITGTTYADYDYGTVTKIECRPLQYFPGSGLTLHEGQNIEHSGNYKTHTIYYTTSKWEKHTSSGVIDPGTSTVPGVSSGSGSHFLQVVYVNKSKTEYSFGPRIASSSNARIWYYNNSPAAPSGYSLAGWQTSHYHGTKGFLTKAWWPIFGNTSTRLYVYSSNDIQYTVALNDGEGVYLIYQANEDPAPPASYSYELNWDYNGGTLNGQSSDKETALNLTGDSNATHTFYEQVNKRPSRDGYTFKGWSYSGNGSYTSSNGRIVMTGRDGSTVSGTMTAQWEVIPNAKATLTYDANGGINPPAAQTVSIGNDVKVSDKGDMTKAGYEFKGWSRDKDASEVEINPNDVLRMNGNVTLYAVWQEVIPAETVTVTWVDEDGTTVLDGPKTFNKGETEPTTDVTPTKAEDDDYTYAFDEWKRSEDEDSNVTYRATYTATPKIKVTVTWKDGYSGAGDDVIKSETIGEGADYSNLKPADPTREGYTFTGWSEPVTDDDGNITITAKWEPVDPGNTEDPENPDDPTPTPGEPDPDDPENPDDPTPTPGDEPQDPIPGPTDPTDPGDGPGDTTPGGDGPGDTTPGGDGTEGTTDTPAAPTGLAAIVAPIVDAAAAIVAPVVEAIGDLATPLADADETIADEDNPLFGLHAPDCWTHWLMILGALITISYCLSVLYRRRSNIHDMDDFEDGVLGKNEERETVSASMTHAAHRTM